MKYKGSVNEKRIPIYCFIFMILMIGLASSSLLYYYGKLNQVTIIQSTSYATYSRHYVLITDSKENEYWNQVYQGALEEAKKQDAYVERMGEDMDLSSEVNDLIRIAIDASVDGIIVPGSDEEERIQLINDAVKKGIPVITVRSDAIKSNRQCFVGINNYNLGKEYGKQIIQMNETRKKPIQKVYVLVEEISSDTSQSITILGIQDAIEKSSPGSKIVVKAIPVNNKSTFGADESIRDVVLKGKNLPDVLVCLNTTYTQCTIQAAVDYNMVGQFAILGYYDSEAILSAVSKNIIDATIGVDTKQMGALCVQALKEYEESGYVSAYEAVKTSVITERIAAKRLEQKQSASTK